MKRPEKDDIVLLYYIAGPHVVTNSITAETRKDEIGDDHLSTHYNIMYPYWILSRPRE